MLDHMVERSGLRRSTGEQSKSVKGNRYYRILQMEKGKRDASLAIVTVPARSDRRGSSAGKDRPKAKGARRSKPVLSQGREESSL